MNDDLCADRNEYPWEYTTGNGRLTLTRVFDGYQLTDNLLGKTVGCGDGTEWMGLEDVVTEYIEWLPPGSPRLHRELAEDMEANEDEWLEAYFGNEPV